MVEARLERGVIWVGANDGPVHVSRDNGKTWKNVTPQGLVGARIQTIEDSPHARGRAYIAAYRFMREHDLKPTSTGRTTTAPPGRCSLTGRTAFRTTTPRASCART